jgi:pyruvate carboxylase subunit B
MEVNEGIRLLTGKGKIDIPLKKKEEAPPTETKPSGVTPTAAFSGPVKSKCVVEENGKVRTFFVTLEPVGVVTSTDEQPSSGSGTAGGKGEAVYSTFAGSVDVVDILVQVGSSVVTGQVVAQIEAMKAKYDIKAPKNGIVTSIEVQVGDEIDSSKPILIIS